MVSTTNKQVIAIGLKSGADPDASKGNWSKEQVLEAIKHQIELANQAGFDMHNCQVDPEKSDDQNVEAIRTMLQKQRWDGVSIGFGVRGNEAHTALFERLVNAVVEDVQPTPKFIFALRPNLVWEAVSRVFGVE